MLQVNESVLVLEELKTFALLKRLFDNYELHVNVSENITSSKRQQQIEFLNAIQATPHMKETIKYLENKGTKKTS